MCVCWKLFFAKVFEQFEIFCTSGRQFYKISTDKLHLDTFCQQISETDIQIETSSQYTQ